MGVHSVFCPWSSYTMACVGYILSLAIFVVANGEYFHAFNQAQEELVHTPRQERAFVNPRGVFEQNRNFTPTGNFAPAPVFHDIPPPPVEVVAAPGIFERIPNFPTTGNIVDKTEAFVEAAKTIFHVLDNNTLAEITFDEVFETSECLGDVQDVIDLMDEIVKLVKDNSPEIIYLEAIVENLEGERDINEQISGSVKMVRTLGHLVPNLASLSPKLCISNPKASYRSFKSLAHALIDIRTHREIQVDDIVRQHLEFSSKVMSDTANFLKMIIKSVERFRTTCEKNSMKDAAVYDTIVDIMDSLADLFTVLGFDDKVAAIKRQATFVKRITRPFEDLEEIGHIDTHITCDFDFGSANYEELALTLADLGELIKNVGIEKLAADLGIGFELGLINEF